MGTVGQQIESAADTISANIAALDNDRTLLARNVLGQLRNLTEGVAVILQAGRADSEFQYSLVGPAMRYVAAEEVPVIYNNLKGRLAGIQVLPGHIQFDVSLDRPIRSPTLSALTSGTSQTSSTPRSLELVSTCGSTGPRKPSIRF